MQGYSVTAQYYDPLMAAAHADADRHIAEALEGLNTSAGPVIDVGAGTGLTTALIAQALPSAEIFAVEPDPAMRPALMARIWQDADLRRRVTILPFDILAAPLPDFISGAVMSASLVHLGPDERACLWPMLAQRLARSGRIVVEVQCPIAQDIAYAEMPGVSVGRMTYDAGAAAQQIAPDRQRWRMTYRTCLEGREIACDTTSYECWAISAQMICDEAAQAGLVGRIGEDLVILTRPLDGR